jgi:hypothetical protein
MKRGMSANGTFETSVDVYLTVAFGDKPELLRTWRNRRD